MIDEKKREEAASKYASSSWIDDEYPGEIQEAFNEGINWLLDNLWHDASEEPKDKAKEILYESDTVGYATTSSKYSVLYEREPWRCTVSRLAITRWLYIDDLLKGGGQ